MKTNTTTHLKASSIGLLSVVLIVLFGVKISAQTPISPYLLGNNYWYHSSEGIKSLYEPGGPMDKADFQTIRIGGFGANGYSDEQYLEFIKRIQASGSKVICQVKDKLSAQQARDLITKINITEGLNVKVWSVGNEPDHRGGGHQTDEQIQAYTLRIAGALKEVDPTIKVIALEFAGYSGERYRNLLGGENSITGKVPGKDYYYVDVVGFHKYDFTDANILNDDIDDLISILNEQNKNRPEAHKLQWGMGEFNSHYNNDRASNEDLYVWSFNNGQMHAELYGIGMAKKAFFLASWSTFEGPDRAGTDLSLFDKDMSARSNYWHSFMLGTNMKKFYLDNSDNQKDVAIVAMGDETGSAVMIINKNRSTAYDYSLKLDMGAVKGGALQINVNAGINATITGNIGAFCTKMLVFDPKGSLVKTYTYDEEDALAKRGPDIE